MQIVEPYAKIIAETPDMEKLIEYAIRHCYKSEDKITPDSYERMIKMVIQNGHTSTLEHGTISVELLTNRGVLGEITRHRVASFSVESTRYCNYSSDKKGMKICRPFWMDKAVADSMNKQSEWTTYCLYDDIPERDFTPHECTLFSSWYQTIRTIEENYNMMIDDGCQPQLARGILPLDLAVSMVLTANVREWRHILNLRHDGEHAHPDIVYLMDLLLQELNEKHPILFPLEDFPSA